MISYEDFSKIKLKIAKIIAAERIEGSEKLLKLKVVADEERQIIAGIGVSYAPEALIGKEIIIVANFQPRILMGLESQGMLLAAGGEHGPVLLAPDKEVAPGAQVT